MSDSLLNILNELYEMSESLYLQSENEDIALQEIVSTIETKLQMNNDQATQLGQGLIKKAKKQFQF
jgi:hypothetical protein